jgi:NAD(P)-dependent dehydrogenase (short-subunit alcohol dehydrogenase family)
VCIDALRAEYSNVDYRTLQVDLSSQQSVRTAANEVLSWADIPKIDVIINSAGVMGIQERTLSVDGIEMHFATNHIGHYLLSCLLMPKLLKAAETNPKGATRIINVTSLSPTVSKMRWSDINFDKINKDLPEVEQPNYGWFKAWRFKDPENQAYVPLDGYDRSKVANVLFSVALTMRLYDRGIVSMAVHPGVIHTELGRNFPDEMKEAVGELMKAGHFSMKTLGAGASTSLVAAFDPKLGEVRQPYLIDCQVSDKAHPLAVSSEEAERLWKLSEKLVGQEFGW